MPDEELHTETPGGPGPGSPPGEEPVGMGDFSIARPTPGFLDNMAEVAPGLFFRAAHRHRQQRHAIERLLEGPYGTVLVSDQNVIRLRGLFQHFVGLESWQVTLLLRDEADFARRLQDLTTAMQSSPFEKRLVFIERLADEEPFPLPGGATLRQNAAGQLCAFRDGRQLPRVALVRLDPAHIEQIEQTADRVAHAANIRGRLPGDAYHIIVLEPDRNYQVPIGTENMNQLLALHNEQERGLALSALEHNWPVRAEPKDHNFTAFSGGPGITSSSGGAVHVIGSSGGHRVESPGGQAPAGREQPRPVPPTLRGSFDPSGKIKRDPVDVSLYAPPEARPSDYLLVQVFIHTPESEGEAQQQAAQFDADSTRRGTASLGTAVRRGAWLTFELFMSEVEVTEPIQNLIWRGVTDHVTFPVHIPSGLPPHTLTGRLLVSQEGIPIGRIFFKLRLCAAKESPIRKRRFTGLATRYTLAFISYATPDRREVLRRVQMLPAVGIRYFQDVLDLDPGDPWADILLQRIDESNVMFLFWSSAAKASEWVQKEWRYGLEKKGSDYIRPVIIEGPPIPEPPPELQHLHFSDKILYFLNPQA